jgi:hypothetical protein
MMEVMKDIYEIVTRNDLNLCSERHSLRYFLPGIYNVLQGELLPLPPSLLSRT